MEIERTNFPKGDRGKVVSSLVSFKYLPCFFLFFVRSPARSARPLMSSKGLLSVLLGHPVSSAEAFLCRGEAGEREKRKRVGDDGKGKGIKRGPGSRLFPLPIVPRALYF